MFYRREIFTLHRIKLLMKRSPRREIFTLYRIKQQSFDERVTCVLIGLVIEKLNHTLNIFKQVLKKKPGFETRGA